jgi:hypothetical protein
MGPKKNIDLVTSRTSHFNYDEFHTHVIASEKECPGATFRNFGMSPHELLKKMFPERFAEETAKVKAIDEEKEIAAALKRTTLWFDPVSRPLDRWPPKPGQIDTFGNMTPPAMATLRRARLAESLPYAVEKDTASSRNRVTSFSNWIYRIHHPETQFSPAQREGGRQVENLVQVRKERVAQERRAQREHIGEPMLDNVWQPLFIDDFSDTQAPLESSLLRVNNQSIFGRPDYLFFNHATKTALIVEVKSSDTHSLPEQGWPNLRCQLWAYGHLDEVQARAEHIILVGEVWGKQLGQAVLRQTYQWDLTDQRFHNEQKALFGCFQRHAAY